MNLIGYDALNLGGLELYLGLDFLRNMNSKFSLPFLSSNLIQENGTRIPWIKDNIIKDIAGLKVAFLGIMPTDAFEKIPHPGYVKNLKIIPPEKALNDLLPDIKKKADFLVLLSQCGFETTATLVNSLKGIDLAISCGTQKPSSNYGFGPVPVLQTGSQGKQLGHIQLTKNDTGAMSIGQGVLIELDESAPSDSRIEKIVKDVSSKIFQEKRRLADERRHQKSHQALIKGLESTPEKFLQMEQERKTRKNTGEYK